MRLFVKELKAIHICAIECRWLDLGTNAGTTRLGQ